MESANRHAATLDSQLIGTQHRIKLVNAVARKGRGHNNERSSLQNRSTFNQAFENSCSTYSQLIRFSTNAFR
jgi:hypothetical protein